MSALVSAGTRLDISGARSSPRQRGEAKGLWPGGASIIPEMSVTVEEFPGLPAKVPASSRPEPELDLVEDELLVEEISIDGMCGVY